MLLSWHLMIWSPRGAIAANFLPELVAFMHKWLVTHIMHEDTKIRNG